MRVLVSASLACALVACGGGESGSVDDPTGTPPSAPSAEQGMDHSAGDAMHHADQAPQGIQPGQKNIVGSATGVVRGVSEDGRAIVVDHGPIDGLGMGAMTMSFQLDDEATGGDVAVGDTVEFQVVEDGDDFRIIELSVR